MIDGIDGIPESKFRHYINFEVIYRIQMYNLWMKHNILWEGEFYSKN